MDIIGSAVSDTVPRFKAPAELIPASNRPSVASPYLQSLLSKLRSPNSTALNDIAFALEEASHVAEVVNHQIKTSEFWNSGMNGAKLIGPLSHQLLSLPRVSESILYLATCRHEALREMVRLTLLIVLARLKLVFTQIAFELRPLENRFTRTFAYGTSRHDGFPELQLWALAIVGSSAAQGPSRDLYKSRICGIAGSMGIKGGATAFLLVKDIFLLDDMMASDVGSLIDDSI